MINLDYFAIISIHVISQRRVQKEKKAANYCMYGSVTRYGPRTSCKRKRLNTFQPNRMQNNYYLSV